MNFHVIKSLLLFSSGMDPTKVVSKTNMSRFAVVIVKECLKPVNERKASMRYEEMDMNSIIDSKKNSVKGSQKTESTQQNCCQCIIF